MSQKSMPGTVTVDPEISKRDKGSKFAEAFDGVECFDELYRVEKDEDR